MTNHILGSLNPQQQEAVQATDGPVLIIAGPGSGKTRVLTHRVAYLIQEKGVDPSSILCVTFTNKAAQEMKTRVEGLLGAEAKVPWIGTYHATCAKILRRDAHHIGLSRSFTIYDDTDSKTALKQLIKKHVPTGAQIKEGAVLHTIQGAKNELIDEHEYPTYAHGHFQHTVASLYPRYQKLLAENDAVDFGDLISRTVYLLRDHPEVLAKYQQQFQYVLVDEYQDTNHAQYTLTKMISAEHKNLCVVGDVNQAIYSWRGADFRNILQFEKDFPDTQIFRLEQNYRSTKSIVNAAKGVIERGKHHLHLDLWTENDEGEEISLFEANNEQEESEYVVSVIVSESKAHESIAGLNVDLPESITAPSLNDYAVLYRTNAQSRAIEDTFLRWGIPYRIVGGMKFYDRKEVKDVLAYLRLLQNPTDSVARERIEKLGVRRTQRFDLLRQETNPDDFTVIELMDKILTATGYLDKYSRDNDENRERKENVKELRTVAAQFTQLDEFLENVALVQNDYFPGGTKSDAANQPAVTLMTLHSAKGLEFKNVFLVGLEEGLFPHSRALTSPDELEEERRLCYVGITRAEEKLHLSYARNRMYFGTRQYGVPSRFLEDVPSHLLRQKFSGTF